MRVIYGDDFEEVFKNLNESILVEPDYITDTRIGEAYEALDVMIECSNPESFIIEDENINRISYDYAEDFWNFLKSGGTDAEEAFKQYPNVAKFITKPKSPELPNNFNTFYGPRINAQILSVIDELDRNPNTRRASLMILDGDDSALLDKDESLEYPCTISYSFTVRDETLFMHSVMRSQNAAIVLQLDIYLQGKLFELIKNTLINKGHTINKGVWTCYMQNAHIFMRDKEYVENFLNA